MAGRASECQCQQERQPAPSPLPFMPRGSTQLAGYGWMWRPGGRYTGLLAATWVPMGAGVAVLSPNDDPNLAQRPQGWER